MIKIQSTMAGFPQVECTELLIRPIINSTTDKSCNTYWELRTDKQIIASGNCQISEEEYALWDATNESLENIVLNKLKLNRL